ncbi:MAG TPA: diadenylate cyclase CdaA [Candidatus Limnocylindria bacterium]|nr:diadenylate cyclase CdaA [Candidatus Limnocylindria bacterium]
MDQLLELVRGFEVQPVALLDILLVAVLIYGLFSMIRGTRAVRLVIGVTVLYAVYVAAQTFGLQLLSQIMQAGAVVGLLALVVVFQPELRRALERIGRVGSLSWVLAPGAHRSVERVASVLAASAAELSGEQIGALIVIERETGLQDAAEAGVMIEADLSVELLGTIFTPHSPLHDGAVIVRGERILAAAVVLPLSDSGLYRERFGTRHRAALGITEQTDALAIVVSEETGAIGLVERGRIVRNLDEEKLRRALSLLLNRGANQRRLPATAAAWRRGLPIRRRVHARRLAKAAGARAASTPAASEGGRVE